MLLLFEMLMLSELLVLIDGLSDVLVLVLALVLVLSERETL